MFDATGDGLPKKVQSVSLNKPILRRGLSRTGFRVSDKIGNVEEKVVVIHRGGCNNKVYYRLSHDVVT